MSNNRQCSYCRVISYYEAGVDNFCSSMYQQSMYISKPHYEGLPSDRLICGQDFSIIESQNRLMIVLVLEIASLSLKLLYLEQYCAKTLYGYLSCMGIFCI